MIRAAKSALIVLFGLHVTVLALNNIVNFDVAASFVSFVVSQSEHTVYPVSLFPALPGDVVAVPILCLIIAAELSAGAVLLKGGADMARAVRQPAAVFEQAKSFALLGCLMAIGVWFGLFVVIAGTFYQMWQTPLGRGSFDDSQTIVMFAGLLFLLVRSPDGDAPAA